MRNVHAPLMLALAGYLLLSGGPAPGRSDGIAGYPGLSLVFLLLAAPMVVRHRGPAGTRSR